MRTTILLSCGAAAVLTAGCSARIDRQPASAGAPISIRGAAQAFAPEIDWSPGSSYASPAFTPDGKTVYFTRSQGAKRTIVFSRRIGAAWSAPEVAPFSGTWRDIEPAMAPDGSYLVFVSNRPRSAGGKPLDGFFGGQIRPGAGGAIWRVDLHPHRDPVRLPDVVNATSATYSPAVAGDGSVYFNRPDPYTWRSHIYRAQAHGATFLEPEPLSISDGSTADFDAAVPADESFIVFSSNRPPAAGKEPVLFVSYRRAGKWIEPQPLTPITAGLEARLSPDRRTLYFEAELPAAEGAQAGARIYQIPLLAAPKPNG